jgi:hypothetical protein
MKNYIIKVDLKTPISLSHLGGLFRSYGLYSHYKIHQCYKNKIFVINLNVKCNVDEVKKVLIENNKQYLKNNDCQIYDLENFKLHHQNIYEKIKEKDKNFFNLEFDEFTRAFIGVGRIMMEKHPIFPPDVSKQIHESTKNISELLSKVNIRHNTSFFEKIKKRFIKEDVKLNPVINIFINEEKNVINLENLDDILEKISSKGIDTLTDNEINFLKNYSDAI